MKKSISPAINNFYNDLFKIFPEKLDMKVRHQKRLGSNYFTVRSGYRCIYKILKFMAYNVKYLNVCNGIRAFK